MNKRSLSRFKPEVQVADRIKEWLDDPELLAEEIAYHLTDKAFKEGDTYVTLCPVHDDTKPSLKVKVYNGTIDLKCWSHGCSPKDIASHLPEEMQTAMHLLWKNNQQNEDDYQFDGASLETEENPVSWPKKAFPVEDHPRMGRPDKVYWFLDEDGGYRYGEARWGDGKEKKISTFSFDLDFQQGIWKGPEERNKVLYNLQQVRKAIEESKAVYFVEGPKDADTLRREGLVATTIAGGCKAKWLPQYSEALRGADIVILPDNDDPGRKFANQVQKELEDVAAAVRLVELPELPPGGDVTDYLEHNSVEDLLHTVSPIKNAAMLIAAPEPPLTPIIEGTLNHQDVCFVIGGSKTRKTFYAMQLGLCVATGAPFVTGKVPEPCRVFYANLELKDSSFTRRLKRMVGGLSLGSSSNLNNFYVSNLRGREKKVSKIFAEARSKQADLVIIDPLYMIAEGDENSARDTTKLFHEIESEAAISKMTVCVVHHDAKGGSDRATIDRGSGSGVLGRYADATLVLTPHRDEIDGLVLEYILRDYAPRDPETIRFDYGSFEVSDAPAVKAQTGGKKAAPQNQVPLEDHIPQLKKVIEERQDGGNAMHLGSRRSKDDERTLFGWIVKNLGLSIQRADELCKFVKDQAKQLDFEIWSGQNSKKFIGIAGKSYDNNALSCQGEGYQGRDSKGNQHLV